MDAEFVRYEADDGIAVITINRPQAANAQNPQMLKELDQAWTDSDLDRDVRVVVLRSEGKHFSAGHDMQGGGDPSLGPQRVDGALTVDTYFDWEERGYLHYAKRWRDLVKPSIAAVQGKCIAAGLMLCWPCDLIIAADNAQFSDPVGLMGMPGVEFFAHPWEFGPRRAKQILFTASSLSAELARECGMVNEVVTLDALEARTMTLASEIAAMDPWAVRLAKRAVNSAVDAMGFSHTIATNFDIHHLGHARAIAHTKGTTSVMADLASMKARGQ
ncbi:MAG TPA: enoyl-CoA hydratase [Acidimicrobiales bacterium]